MSQEGYRQALVVMQQLKERNDSLREKNAELAEEMFVPDTWQICHEKAKTIQKSVVRTGGPFRRDAHENRGMFLYLYIYMFVLSVLFFIFLCYVFFFIFGVSSGHIWHSTPL